jgi:hypothetical protein
MKKISFVGDISFSGDFDFGKPKFSSKILDNFFTNFCNEDLLIGNLETVFTTEKKGIKKFGPRLKSSPYCVDALHRFDFLSLANNHCNDFGLAGLSDTLSSLDKIDCISLGALVGDLDSSVVKIENSIYVISASEREFNLHKDYGYGAEHFDMIDLIYKIKKIKDHDKKNTVILFLHTGVEYYSLPTPNLVRKLRALIDFGADAIVCSHSHVIGPTEIYKEKPICYGLGNFLFDTKAPIAKKGMVATLAVKNSQISLEIDFVKNLPSGEISFIRGNEKEELLSEQSIMSNIVSSDDLLNVEFQNFVSLNRSYYLNSTYMGAVFPGVHKLSRLLGMEKFFVNSSNVARKYNMYSCESHQEVVLTLLKGILK